MSIQLALGGFRPEELVELKQMVLLHRAVKVESKSASDLAVWGSFRSCLSPPPQAANLARKSAEGGPGLGAYSREYLRQLRMLAKDFDSEYSSADFSSPSSSEDRGAREGEHSLSCTRQHRHLLNVSAHGANSSQVARARRGARRGATAERAPATCPSRSQRSRAYGRHAR